jgi:hypothetical protein
VSEDDRAPRRDPVYEFQRWLVRNGAKSMGRELKGTVSRTIRGNRQEPSDVWGTATTEPPPNVGEAPECAWCPVCRAARRFRDSGPGLASHVAGAGDALLSVAQDTLAAFEASLSTKAPSAHKSPAGTGWPGEPGDPPADAGSPPVPTGPPPTAHTTPPPPPPAPTGPPPAAQTAPPNVPATQPPAPAGPPPAAPVAPPVAGNGSPRPPHSERVEPPSVWSAATAASATAGPAEAEPDPAGPATAEATETGPADSGPSGAGTGPADDT